MRTITVFCGIVVALLGSATPAQNTTEYELQHSVAESKRQAVVASNLSLSDSEAEKFWDLYREYRTGAKEMDDTRVKLLQRYAGNSDALSGKDGRNLVADALRVEKKRQALKKRYLGKFGRILSGQRLFRYYQIETKLDAMQRYGWTRLIPLATEIE